MIMKKNVIENLKVELDYLKLPCSVSINENIKRLTNRQFELLYTLKYFYVRHYISWLFENGCSLFEVAYFVRATDRIEVMSIENFLGLSNFRFNEKVNFDFLCDITFSEYCWLCANIDYCL